MSQGANKIFQTLTREAKSEATAKTEHGKYILTTCSTTETFWSASSSSSSFPGKMAAEEDGKDAEISGNNNHFFWETGAASRKRRIPAEVAFPARGGNAFHFIVGSAR